MSTILKPKSLKPSDLHIFVNRDKAKDQYDDKNNSQISKVLLWPEGHGAAETPNIAHTLHATLYTLYSLVCTLETVFYELLL